MNAALSLGALSALRTAVVEGTGVRLVCGQLDRATYREVNEALERLGGKWKGGRVRAHLFAFDPSNLLADVVAVGRMPVKNPDAFFPTPAPVVTRMLALAELDALPERPRFLEPSVGTGAIARAVRAAVPHAVIHAVEISAERAAVAARFCDELLVEDFLNHWRADAYDRVLMNPPFTSPDDRLVYVEHVRRAWAMLAPGGVLVAVAPSGFVFREDRRCVDFRGWVRARGMWEDLPAGSFTESGTGAGTVLITLRRGAA